MVYGLGFRGMIGVVSGRVYESFYEVGRLFIFVICYFFRFEFVAVVFLA